MGNGGKKEIHLSMDRIGGEADFLVFQENGIVKDAYFVTRAPVRGFEKLVLGKNPVFVVNAVMRICGICHAAHGIASSEAFEDAMGIAPPYNGRLLREAIGLVNRVQSHILHLILMIPDMVPQSEVERYSIEVISLFNEINDILGDLGGSPTHPPRLVIGGVSKAPKEEVIGKILGKLSELKEKYSRLKNELLERSKESERVEELKGKEYLPRTLASHLYYGDKYCIDLDKVAVMKYEEYRKDLPEEARGSTSMIATYGGQFVEVGPRARLRAYRGFGGSSIWDIQIARFEEIALVLERIGELLEKVEVGEPTLTRAIQYGPGQGVGVYEAPRGTLIHRVEMGDEGRVKYYKIVVPTMFNIPHMEMAARGLNAEIADSIPRIYDPCVPCSTHVIKVV